MYSNTFSLVQYIDLIRQNKHPIITGRSFSSSQRMRYDFLLKLLQGSHDLSQIKKNYGSRFWLHFPKELLCLLATRAITIEGNNITLTPKGRYYWIVIMRTFFSVVGDHRDMRASLNDASLSTQKVVD